MSFSPSSNPPWYTKKQLANFPIKNSPPKYKSKNILKRRIEALDSEIEQLVYLLYDLTEEEIKIVENGLKI